MNFVLPRRSLTVAVSFALASVALAASSTVAPFNSSVEGFVAGTTSTTVIFANTGGNPAGHLQLRKATGPDAFPLSAATTTSTPFLGDYAAAGITGAGFDIATLSNTFFTEARIRVRRSTSENGWFFNLGAIAFQNNYQSFDVTFDPTWSDVVAFGNGWAQDDLTVPSFAATFASVGWFEIRLINDPSTSAIVDIDNVRLIPAPSAGVLTILGLCAMTRRRRALA